MTSITSGIQYDCCPSKKGNLGIEVYIEKGVERRRAKRLCIRQEEKPGTKSFLTVLRRRSYPAKTEILDS